MTATQTIPTLLLILLTLFHFPVTILSQRLNRCDCVPTSRARAQCSRRTRNDLACSVMPCRDESQSCCVCTRPSPSPAVAPVPTDGSQGSSCFTDSDCQMSLQCACSFICTRRVDLRFRVVSSDLIRSVYICGSEVRGSFDITDRGGAFRYQGLLSAIMINTTNFQGPTAVNVFVREIGGQQRRFGTLSTRRGVGRLDGAAMHNPAFAWQFDSPFFDYSRWTRLVLVDAAVRPDGIIDAFRRNQDSGAWPAGPTNVIAPQGTWAYRIPLPL